MSTISLKIPPSLQRKAEELAAREGVSLDQLITTALAEKLSALLTEDYLQARGARGDAQAFREVLDRVPDAPVEADDRM